ncbi:hypothetical protein V2I01_36050 [Micromonospora sp. BRA006-A]|nr:hypothetical protein [Micromonospora sp. BRA006-A]
MRRTGVLHRLPWGYHALFRLTGSSRTAVRAIRALMRCSAAACAAASRRHAGRGHHLPVRQPAPRSAAARGRLRVPVITYVTDFVVHPTWLAPGVDVYCAVRHAETHTAGAADVTAVQPLVSRAFARPAPEDRRRARQRFRPPGRRGARAGRRGLLGRRRGGGHGGRGRRRGRPAGGGVRAQRGAASPARAAPAGTCWAGSTTCRR